MSSETARFGVNQFILECSELAVRLNSAVKSCGDMDVVSAFKQGRQDLDRLISKRDALPMADADEPLVQVMLDGVLVRLEFLQRRA